MAPGKDRAQQLQRWLLARRVALLLLLLAGVLLLILWRLFLAQPSHSQWAQCLWREVPTSTANWLAMETAGGQRPSGEPAPGELLKARLLGACAEPLAPLGRAAAEPPDWAGLSGALRMRYPPRVAEDASDPRAFVCEVFFADDAVQRLAAEYDWGHGDFNTGTILARRRLPAASRPDGTALGPDNSARFCRLIGPDGRPGRDRFQRAPLAEASAG